MENVGKYSGRLFTGDNMADRTVTIIKNVKYANFGQKAVGIYARVSTRLPSQLNSLSSLRLSLNCMVLHKMHYQRLFFITMLE
jgi:hypothetical protein